MDRTGNKVKNLIRDFHETLIGLYPDSEIRQFIYMLFEEYLGWQKTKLHLTPDAEIPGPVMDSFNRALVQLRDGWPIQYILSKSWFNGTLLRVDRHVLVPRPETAELCSIIRADYPDDKNRQLSILDIGTGSGCIAIDLKKYFAHASVSAVDVSMGALEIATENACSNQCEIFFIHEDILNELNWKRLGNYNLIVSNPPYVTEREKTLMHRNVTEFEPAGALFVSDRDPLIFYRAITRFASTHLMPPARLYFEINERFGREVSELVLSFGFDEVRILPDFHGKERFISAILKSPSVLPL